MQTPDSLKLGTSSFGGKQSTVHKTADDNTQMLHSSLRGIFNTDDISSTTHRRDTIPNTKQTPSTSTLAQTTNGLGGDASYQKMQTNLKSLQDKIRDLETKLTRVGDD